MDWQPAFGLVLRNRRESRGLTQEELAKRVGRVRGTVNGWENGRHFPSKADIVAALKIVGADPTEFFGEVGAHCGALLGGDTEAPSEPPEPGDPVTEATEMLDAKVQPSIGPLTHLPRYEARPERDALVRALEDFIERAIDRRRP